MAAGETLPLLRWSGTELRTLSRPAGLVVGTINRYEIKRNPKYRKIANKLIRTKDDLEQLRNSNCKVVYLSSQQEKKTGSGTKLVCGECIKVKDSMQWICRYDFMIVVYEPNCVGFTDLQFELLLWHELKHIGFKPDTIDEEYYVVPHDIEDFRVIIDEYGLDWNNDAVERHEIGENNAERRQSEQQEEFS